MKKSFVNLVVLFVLVLCAPCIVSAQEYIADAAKVLKTSQVYVAPGTERTNDDTSVKLRQVLRKDDSIVLVMLPASAAEGTTALQLAQSLSEALGNRRIIGLAVGRTVVGYAPRLPEGVASEHMRNANIVSQDPVTALTSYVQNVHKWQAANPQPVQKPAITEEPGSFPVLLVIVLLIAILVVGGSIILTRSPAKKDDPSRTRFEAPDQVRDLLTEIAQLRGRVKDDVLSQALFQLCVDVEKYFEGSSKDKKRDSRVFSDRLAEVKRVVLKYIEIQNNRRYYEFPDREMLRGKESIERFSQYVLKSIRSGKAADLLEYSVDTDILHAQSKR